MKKIISIVLAILILSGNAVNFSKIESMRVFAAESEFEPNSTNKKVGFDLDAYDFTDPSQLAAPVPQFLTDEKFFGKWDKSAQTYVIEGKLDYDYVSPYRYGLTAVEEAVKEGDYETAKAEYLEYHRGVVKTRGMPVGTTSREQTLTSDLLLQGFHYNGNSGQLAVDIFSVNGQTNSWIESDVLTAVESYRDSATKEMVLYLYAINKDDYEAEFYSKEAGSEYAPYLEVVAGGSTLRIPVKADTYVSAGENAGKNYGSEQRLLARECVGGWANPVTSDTKQIYLMFDLSSIREGTPVFSAKLKMYGKYTDKAAVLRNNPNYEKNIAVLSNNTTWVENTVNFVTVLHPAFSYDGQYGFDWLSPINAVVNGTSTTTWHGRMHEELLRFATWWDGLTREYLVTGDEDYARAAMMYLDDFIKETFYIYNAMPGGIYDGWTAKDYSVGGTRAPNKPVFKYNWDTVENKGNGVWGGYSETLDASTRANCLALNLPNLYFSEYMTPEIFTTFSKYMWSMSDHFHKNWSSSENGGNWGTSQCRGAYRVMLSFPEFTDIHRAQTFTMYTNLNQGSGGLFQGAAGTVRTGSWMDIMWENLSFVTLGNVVHSDGSSHELSLSYTDYALSTLIGLKSVADEMDTYADYSPELQEAINTLAIYLVNQSMPGFYDNQKGDGGSYERNYKDARIKPIADWLKDPLLLWAVYGEKNGGIAPDYTSHFYPAGKIMTMRSDWTKDALYLQVDADGGDGTHAHWDDLAVVISAYGDYLLTDPLYNVQSANEPARRWLVSSKGHNTVEINDYCQAGINPTNVETVLPDGGGKGDFERVTFTDSYDFTKIYGGPNFKNIRYSSQNDASFIRDKLPTATEPGMDFTRNILFVKPNFWIVSDYMNPIDKNKVNKYTQMWHMRPESDMKIDGQYELQPGEQIGYVNGVPDDITAETVIQGPMQVSNTQYVPGTGTGAFYSNNPKGANIKVVPANVDNVTPKLLYGVYHPNLLVPYGVFEQNVKGTTNMDTILFPTKAGKDYDITPEPIELDMPVGAASAFSSNIKDISGTGNTNYNFSYYILHENDKKKNVEFGSYEVDGSLAYYETTSGGTQRRLILQDATRFMDNDISAEVVYSTSQIADLSVEWVGRELHLDSDTAVNLDNLTILSPNVTSKVTLNGASIPFKQHNNYVYFGTNYILSGTPISDNNTGNGGGQPGGGNTHGGGGSVGGAGGSGSSGSIGGGDSVINTKPSDSFKAELLDHWGSAEISYLIDNGIINGSNGMLNLNQNTTRAEFITMLLRANNIAEVPYNNCFSDVNADDWFSGYIQAAYDNKIMEGSYGNASPNSYITREEAVKIILKILETKTEVLYASDELDFSDNDNISDWAKEFVSTAVKLGLVNGMGDNMFMPKNSTLREQAMIMTYRVLNFLASEE